MNLYTEMVKNSIPRPIQLLVNEELAAYHFYYLKEPQEIHHCYSPVALMPGAARKNLDIKCLTGNSTGVMAFDLNEQQRKISTWQKVIVQPKPEKGGFREDSVLWNYAVSEDFEKIKPVLRVLYSTGELHDLLSQLGIAGEVELLLPSFIYVTAFNKTVNRRIIVDFA